MKYCYPQKAGLPRCKNFTSDVFLCFGAIDFLLYFVWWLLFTFFMSLVRLVGFCTEDECKNLWLNCCVNCLNCKAEGKPLPSQYDLYVSKMTSLTELEIISGGSPDTMTGQIHFNSTHPLRVAKNCTTHPLLRVQKLMTHPLSALAHPPYTFWPVPYYSNFSVASIMLLKLCIETWFNRQHIFIIVNRGEWLWNSSKFFVVCFCSLFWPWPCTKHNSCLPRIKELTNRNVLVM